MAESLSPDQVLDAMSGWSLLQLKDFTDKFCEKFDVSASAAPVMMAGMPAGGAAAGAEAAEEQTEFDVVLTSVGSQKIKVIKEVRALVPDLGLKEAKDKVDAAPTDILKGVSKEEAEKAKAQLEEAGASVEIK
jgi:large subunit ribosomal protein L7/L12